LARLLYVMCRPSTSADNLRSQMLPGSHQITSRHPSGAPMNFEYLDVKSRAYMLQAVVSLFADWPNYLIETLRSTNPLHYHLHLFKDLPSWYERAERVAMIPCSKPNPSERDKLLHVATRQGSPLRCRSKEGRCGSCSFCHDQVYSRTHQQPLGTAVQAPFLHRTLACSPYPKGTVFAGVSLSGTSLGPDGGANENLYGRRSRPMRSSPAT
jgi:hypothetical protein